VEAAGVDIDPDDLARAVDAECLGGASGQGIVEGGVGGTAKKEAVGAAGVFVKSDDLARAVDAECLGAVGGQGIVEGGVGVNWHDTRSSLSRFCREPQSES